MRLRRSHPERTGWTRRRVGRGVRYLDQFGVRIQDAAALERLEALAIPPAWRDVWICPYPNGHIQAIGTDDRGRRQYLYHPVWREQRDRAKHERVLEFGAALPAAREHARRDLTLPGMPRERALATGFRLLDLGFFRVGGESYAEENGSFGLATLRKEHVRLDGGSVVFEYVAKHGKERVVAIADSEIRDAVAVLKRRRGGGPELLAWRDGTTWRDVTSEDINRYVKQLVGEDVTAKDFRTWHATVLAAVALAVSTAVATSPTARKRAVTRAVKEVSEYLGNTPAVCRASYIDPRVVDLYADGVTIEPALTHIGEGRGEWGDPATHGAIEAAVLQLLGGEDLRRTQFRRTTQFRRSTQFRRTA